MKRAYADRSKHLGDMDFYDVPFSLMDKKYAKALNKSISLQKVSPSKDILPGDPYPYETVSYTHLTLPTNSLV